MKLPALLVSDLHLVLDPVASYRWDLFPWLARQCANWGVKTLCILGDVTDAKDYHPAELINQIVRNLVNLLSTVPSIVVLRGNHDYLKDGSPPLLFLNHIPGITFVNTPTDTGHLGASCLWLPHSKNPEREWKGMDMTHFQFVFMHQTLKGAVASNGQAMEGEPLPDTLAYAGKVWSGDIHVPQVIGPVEYVGSPYHVHLGDNFRPRCVVISEDGTYRDIRFRTLSRVAVDISGADDLDDLLRDGTLRNGDHLKARVHLPRAALHEWQTVRSEVVARAQANGLRLLSVELVAPKTRPRGTSAQAQAGTPLAGPSRTPAGIVQEHVEREGLGADMLDMGLDLL